MRHFSGLIVGLALLGCGQEPAPETNALQKKVTELQVSLDQLQERFPVTAQLAPGLAKADGTCQTASDCIHHCCTWRGESCYCDACCIAFNDDFLAAVADENGGGS